LRVDSSGSDPQGVSVINATLKIKDIEQNAWWRLCKQIADGVPSETDYIFREWSHTKIAVEYLQHLKGVLRQQAAMD
jgi:hypothetical protein